MNNSKPQILKSLAQEWKSFSELEMKFGIYGQNDEFVAIITLL